VTFGLIIVGDEILSGKRSDKHLPKIIELLAQRGLSCPGPSWSATIASASPRR
jgi:molybdopterin-biosynthesis enzyme MoeA-like protein